MKIAKYTTCLVGLMMGLGSTAALSQDLIVNGQGGPYEELIQEAIIKPFMAETGLKVLYDPVGSASQDYAKIKASRGYPGWDVNVMTAAQSLDGCKDGLLERITPEKVPNLASIDPGVRELAGKCGAVHELQYVALLYRTDKLNPAPTSWNVLADSKLEGKIVLPVFSNAMAAQMLQVFSAAAGNDPNDVDPGFKKMVELAPRALAFGETSALMDPYIRQGEAWAMPFYSGRSALMKAEGVPVDFIIPKEGTVPLVATLNVPANAEHKEAAYKFINYWLSKTGQENWAQAYQVGTARADVELPAEFRKNQITTREDIQKLILPNMAVMATRIPQWGDRWEREVVPAAR
ncbi:MULTISPECIES: ABC transporter substrate-binding protein [Hyphomicrobiales]|uniref:ABC transporter substrate-binding protein n=8 Tax=Rhizobium/Agrobacterium group TaxID=227290 RepID=A0A2Z2PXP4_9HYPH|nr:MULTISPECIES: ABC transporter substrate-binding protein [Rhizobium/Agrobacterium group]KAA6481524.1 ABC transporter substrate-binding protein [Agrobacterium sp. ICMP 7243]ARU12265.1 bacterial extracellular solute-binding family protein [Agrobacterium tumefaciens]ASK46564.1 ABC transporter substrate-binding protein [Rhizobium rhizogenes]ASK46731.1 ABC transporter substrate-binding protein [Agrobacterium radiobacter]ASK47249.1 ABC transporter substrate-binding protein [Agrobacterium tomkonis]